MPHTHTVIRLERDHHYQRPKLICKHPNIPITICRGKIAGHPVRVQVHRDVGRHQSQCGRAAGRSAVSDPAKAGEPREVTVREPRSKTREHMLRWWWYANNTYASVPMFQGSLPQAVVSQEQASRLLAAGQRLSDGQRRHKSGHTRLHDCVRGAAQQRLVQRQHQSDKRSEHAAQQCAEQVGVTPPTNLSWVWPICRPLLIVCPFPFDFTHTQSAQVSRLTNIGQPEGARSARSRLGTRLKVEELREPARSVSRSPLSPAICIFKIFTPPYNIHANQTENKQKKRT